MTTHVSLSSDSGFGDDTAGLRVLVKLGAVCEGIARNGIIVDNGPREAIVHSLDREDLQNSLNR